MRRILRAILLVALCCSLWTVHVFAQSFGGGPYGSCGYGNCSATGGSESTVQLPGGLDVAINLYDGEHIPKSGLLILVTPLNGQGKSFAMAQFIIDGQTVHTSTPDEQGTVSWRWYPTQPAGSQVTITVIVTGQAGQTITKTYNVIISASATTSTPATVSPPKISSPVPAAVLHAFQRTPHVVIYAFPYFLFFLLGAGVATSAWGTWREVSATRKLKRELAQLERIAMSRRNFINLASHYLRTPITLLSGGLDFLSKDGIAPDSPLAVSVSGLHAQVEELIHHQEEDKTASNPGVYSALRAHAHPYFWLPASVCAALVCLFDYLAEQADVLSVRSITFYTQLITGILVLSISYFVFRYRQTSKQDKQLTSDRLSLAHQSLAVREQFLHDTVQTLTKLLNDLKASLVGVQDSPGKTYMDDGLQRIERVVQTFTVADRIRGVRSNKPYEPVDVGQLFSRALAQLQKTIQEKGLQIEQSAVSASQVQEPALLQLVCFHLLDNAVMYAPVQSAVSIAMQPTKQGADIHVTDHGPGIPEEEQQALFTPFEKAEGAETFNHEGMGFSLYLDMLIMLYLGGRIGIDSHPGMTTVTVSLRDPTQ